MPKADYAAAIPSFQRAISIDPNFAMAYARLGTCYSNVSETRRAADNARKAYELRDRVSEREKLYIDSHYQQFVIGNLEAARRTYELWAQTYPRDDTPPGNLGDIYAALGSYDKSVSAFQESVRLNPGLAVPYANLLNAYLYVNRLDEAKALAQEIQSRNLDTPLVQLDLYMADFLQQDASGMEREAAGLMGKPGYEALMLYLESDTAAYGGQLGKARELTQRAVESARRSEENEAGAGYEAEGAVREALVGNTAFAKQQAQAALALSSGRDTEGLSAIALALAGDAAQSARVANALGEQFPEDTVVQVRYLPIVRAGTALKAHSSGKAIEALTTTMPYELGGTSTTVNFLLYPIYLRGEAYLATHEGSAAAAEFQKILGHPGVVLNEPIGALARLGLGRAYALSGDKDKAKTAYRDFFALWKNADPDVPILKEAKTEYAKLQ
jgi:eukaryotic-like serine/threonine-protein kinase